MSSYKVETRSPHWISAHVRLERKTRAYRVLAALRQYPGEWVALADDETTVLAAADTAKEAHVAALRQSDTPILYRVPDWLEVFAGYDVRL